jgi:hypothetical protein
MANPEKNGPEASGAADWLNGWRFSVLLGGLLLISFFPVLLGGQAFFHRDYGFLGYPFAYFNQQTLLGGSLPHWNPFIHCGVPHFAQWNTMVLYPGSLIYVLFPLPWSLAWFCILHLLLGGIGMHRLGREMTGCDFAAAFGGVAFPFSGLILGSVIYPNYLVAFAWLPWLYLLLRRAWRNGGGSLVPAALVGTMQMLSGAPELILLTWMLLGCGLVAEYGFTRAAMLPVGRFVGVVLLVAGLSAIQLLPFFQLLSVSQRTAATGTDLWSLPLSGWLNFVMPLAGNFKTMQGVFVQIGQSFLPSVYLGCPAVALAMLGLYRNRDRGRMVELAFGVFCILLAFGSGLFVYRIVTSVIPVGFARFPVKAILPVAFLIPFFAMLGVAALNRREETKQARPILVCSAVVVAVVLIGVGSALVGKSHSVDRASVLLNSFVRVLLLAAVVFLVLRRSTLMGRPRAIASVGVLVIVWLDGITHMPVLNPTVPAAAFQAEVVRAYHEQEIGPLPKLGQGRLMLSPYAERELFTRMVPDFQADFMGQRLAQWGNLNILDGVAKVNGAATLMTSEARDLEVALYAGTNYTNDAMMNFLGVRHVTRTNGILKWAGRTGAQPLFTAGQEVIGTDFDFTNLDWDPSRVVFQSGKNQAPDPGAMVENVKYSAGQIEFNVRAGQPTVVVVAESWDPSWKAEVNGSAAVVEKANHAFMLVNVPAGENKVRMYFFDSSFSKGRILTGLTMLVCLVLWSRGRTDRQSVN